MLAPLLRRPTAAAASSSSCRWWLNLPPLGIAAPAAPAVRLFAAGPAPKQKSSKMRKKLRNGTHTHHTRCLYLPAPKSFCKVDLLLEPYHVRCLLTRSGAASTQPDTKSR